MTDSRKHLHLVLMTLLLGLALVVPSLSDTSPVRGATLTPSYVQGASSDPQSSQSSMTISLPQAEKAGDLNVVAIGWNDTTTTISAVTDSTGNPYQVAVPQGQTTGLRQAIYYAKNLTGDSTTITVKFSQAAAYPDVRVMEYANVDPTSPFDVGGTGAGTATTASSGTVTTTRGNDLVVGAGMTAGGFTGAGSGYTTRMITSPDMDIAEDRVAATAGSYSATASGTNDVWLMQVAAFKAAGS
jgi:hypothetical protein